MQAFMEVLFTAFLAECSAETSGLSRRAYILFIDDSAAMLQICLFGDSLRHHSATYSLHFLLESTDLIFLCSTRPARRLWIFPDFTSAALFDPAVSLRSLSHPLTFGANCLGTLRQCDCCRCSAISFFLPAHWGSVLPYYLRSLSVFLLLRLGPAGSGCCCRTTSACSLCLLR